MQTHRHRDELRRDATRQAKALASFSGRKGADPEEQRHIDEEIKYLTRKMDEAKQLLQDEERKLAQTSTSDHVVAT